jgi:diacylglycerol kinase (ATP)
MLGWLATEVARIGNTLRWSWQGWARAWASQQSLRQWTMVNTVSVAATLVLDLSGGERALILALGFLLLAAELLNSAIEVTVDYISTARDPRAAMAKDCASAAVALTALAGTVAWIAVLWG